MPRARFDASIKTAAVVLFATVVVTRTDLLFAESRQYNIRHWTALADVITQVEALRLISDVFIIIVVILERIVTGYCAFNISLQQRLITDDLS